MELKLGHDIKVTVGEDKKKNIRPPSTYLFGAEAGEGWPEADVGGRRWWRPPPVLWSWLPRPRGWDCKKWIHSHINRGYFWMKKVFRYMYFLR